MYIKVSCSEVSWFESTQTAFKTADVFIEVPSFQCVEGDYCIVGIFCGGKYSRKPYYGLICGFIK